MRHLLVNSSRIVAAGAIMALLSAGLVRPAGAQTVSSQTQPPAAADRHKEDEKREGAKQDQPADTAHPSWHFMQDGVLFLNFNAQGSHRGEHELIGQNWWMGMWGRRSGRQELMLTGMLSLDPATVGKSGYSEIFQVGETFNNRPLIDRQHPHDVLVQAGIIWRFAVSDRTGISIGGAPVGEPALGPVAFMHRPSAVDNPTAPLGHHTFDSTHIAMGVITTTVDHGPWVGEASLFNAREPDEQRWDLLDPGALDSFSGRLWFQPGEWQFQVSRGVLKDPEAFEPGTVGRTTASAAWFRLRGSDHTAGFVAWGRNDTDHGNRNAVLMEASRTRGRLSLYGRFESLQVEIGALLGEDRSSSSMPDGEEENRVGAFTIGSVVEALRWRGFEGGIGADVTWYGVPESLRSAYGSRPVSFHVFFQLRPPVGPMGRMWNMRMSQPMHRPADPHAGHQVSAP